MAVYRVRRTYTADNVPEANSLPPGQLAVNVADDPMVMWVGVPTTIDPSGMVQFQFGDGGGGISGPIDASEVVVDPVVAAQADVQSALQALESSIAAIPAPVTNLPATSITVSPTVASSADVQAALAALAAEIANIGVGGTPTIVTAANVTVSPSVSGLPDVQSILTLFASQILTLQNRTGGP